MSEQKQRRDRKSTKSGGDRPERKFKDGKKSFKSSDGTERRTTKKFHQKKQTDGEGGDFKQKRVRVTCLLCKKTGHRVADCRKAKKIDTDLKDGRRVLSDRARRRQNAKRAREDADAEAEEGSEEGAESKVDASTEANGEAGSSKKRGPKEKKARTAGLAGLCFNCGSTQHSRQNCDQPLAADGAAFAICYICKQTGHLSSKCPQNENGVYPRGGGCRVCGDKYHFVADCPIKQQKRLEAEQHAKNRPARYVASLATSDPNTFEPAVNAPVEHDGRTKKFDKKNKKNTYKTTYHWGTKETDTAASSSQPSPSPSPRPQRPAAQARQVKF